MQIEVFTQSAIKLTKEKVIYFDPYKINKDYHDADYIFITHDHYDHYDEDSLKKIMKEDTKLIIPKCLEEKIIKITYNYFVVDENKEYHWKDFSFKTIPAYNIDKGFHPKEAGYVGYLIEIDHTKYYIMGDTDVTKEAKEVKTDVCFVPIGGYYTMDYKEAAHYINMIKPKKVIPIHYGSIVGSPALKDEFKKLIDKDIEVIVYI